MLFTILAVALPAFAAGLVAYTRRDDSVSGDFPELEKLDDKWLHIVPPELEYIGRPVNMPKGQRIAMLVRGRSFRCAESSCCKDSWDSQMRATLSQMKSLVLPLEENGNKIDIFLADRLCALSRYQHMVYNNGTNRVVGTSIVAADMQASDVRMSLNFLKQSGDVAKKYSHVILIRHDLVFPTSLAQWPTDFNQFNFASKCEVKTAYGEECINDLMFVMPARVFPTFDQAVGTGKCFNSEMGVTFGNGHLCKGDLTTAMSAIGQPVGFVFKWHPARYNRMVSAWVYPYPLRPDGTSHGYVPNA
jgi:hypothetical protein